MEVPQFGQILARMVTKINGAYSTHIELDPKTCLLGYFNEELLLRETTKLVDYCL